jgi:sugar lactone lactonase YvrE
MKEDVENILSVHNRLGEGPLWNNEESALYWVDIEGESFFRFFPAEDKLESYQVGQPVGCLAFRRDGDLLLAGREGIGVWSWANQAVESISNPEVNRKNSRFNDGRVDRLGRFWAGTLGEDDQSKLYRLDQDGIIHTMEKGIFISNGIDWSPDDQVMYYTDSPLRVIYAYDFDLDSGAIENRREFIKVPPTEGVPDGLTVDREGFLWSAHWDGWRVTRYDPDGQVDRVIYLPVQRPTSCGFGGPDLDQLYITSAWTGLSEVDKREQPLAGNLFRLQTDVKGQLVNYYTG